MAKHEHEEKNESPEMEAEHHSKKFLKSALHDEEKLEKKGHKKEHGKKEHKKMSK